MSEPVTAGSAGVNGQQPSLRDYLLSRRANTQAIGHPVPTPTASQTAKQAAPRGTQERLFRPAGLEIPASDERSHVPVEHVGAALSRDAEKLRYHIYDRLMQELDAQRVAAQADEAEFRRAIEDAVGDLIKQSGVELAYGEPNLVLVTPQAPQLRQDIATEHMAHGASHVPP